MTYSNTGAERRYPPPIWRHHTHHGCLQTLAWDRHAARPPPYSPPPSPKLNCKGCANQDLCIIPQKQLNMEPHLGPVMSGSAAKFVSLQRKGSEIPQKHWSQFYEGFHVKQVGGFFCCFFFCMPGCLQCHLWEAENKGRAGGNGHKGLFEQHSAFSPCWPQSPSPSALAAAHIFWFSVRWRWAEECSPPKGNTDRVTPQNKSTVHTFTKVKRTAFAPVDVISSHPKHPPARRGLSLCLTWWLKDGASVIIHNGKFRIYCQLSLLR